MWGLGDAKSFQWVAMDWRCFSTMRKGVLPARAGWVASAAPTEANAFSPRVWGWIGNGMAARISSQSFPCDCGGGSSTFVLLARFPRECGGNDNV